MRIPHCRSISGVSNVQARFMDASRVGLSTRAESFNPTMFVTACYNLIASDSSILRKGTTWFAQPTTQSRSCMPWRSSPCGDSSESVSSPSLPNACAVAVFWSTTLASVTSAKPYLSGHSMPQSLAARSVAVRSALGLLVAASLVSLSGCVGLLSNLIYAAHGNLIPPAYNGLVGKHVAVVCVSNSASFGPTSASVDLSRRVAKQLQSNVTDITVVDPQEVADWIDQHDWDSLDYAALGQGVNADTVVAIDLDRFTVHEGQTMYKGRADVHIVVYDTVGGKREVFSKSPPQITFPAHAGQHTTDISEREFRQRFMTVLASRIARNFFSYEAKEDYAADRTLIR